MRHCFTFVVFLIISATLKLTAQVTVTSPEFTTIYDGQDIKLVFPHEVSLRAYGQKTLSPKNIVRDSTNSFTYIIKDAAPSEFITLDYSSPSPSSSRPATSAIAAKSLSTGIINVYFNHTVSTSAAQYQPAKNLGNTLDDMLVTYINNCQSTMDIAIYNSDSPNASAGIAGAINAAYARGVKVRIIYDGSTSSNMIPLLNPAIPRLASPSSSSYGIMHNKFITFDADSLDPNRPWLWSGSTNWTVAQIDGPDKNNAIAIQDQALAQAYKMEFEEMWGSSAMVPNLANSKFGPYKTNNTPHNFIIGGKVVENYFSPSDATSSHIIDAINSANSDIEIATMLITRDDIRDALIAKRNAGLQIEQGVFDSQNPSGNDIPALKTSLGANNIFQYTGAGIMHHKFLIVDNFNPSSDPLVLTGSHNWSASAEARNDENTLIIHDKVVADQYYQAFSNLYTAAGGLLSTAEIPSGSASVKIVPNPTSGKASFIFDESSSPGDAVLTIYSAIGLKVVEQKYSSRSPLSFDLSGRPAGLYLIHIVKNGKLYQSKLLLK